MAESLALPSVLDWVILAVAVVSVIVGAVRGLFKEALSLVIWIAALIMASLFADDVSLSLARWITAESLRYPLAFAGLFLSVLLLGALIQRMVAMLVKATGLSGLDRVLGMLFGIARAVVLLVVAVAVLEPMVGLEPWWLASMLVPHLLELQEQVMELLQQAYTAVSSAMAN